MKTNEIRQNLILLGNRNHHAKLAYKELWGLNLDSMQWRKECKTLGIQMQIISSKSESKFKPTGLNYLSQ